MEQPVPVSAGWALWSKQPGTRSDYSLLATSGEPLSEGEFASVVAHFVAGTPTTEPGRPDSLPWVTISRVGVADVAYLGISIVDATGAVDGTGRPIARTSYFCIPFNHLPRPVSYFGLWKRLVDYELPYRDGLIDLSVPALNAMALAADIERFGESVVQDTAALLLSGPVNVIGADNIELEERLHFLDAVASLLPYGYRAGGYTAATWSDSGTRHPIRLAFASRPRPNAKVVRWRSGATEAVSGPGQAYLARLRQLREQTAGARPEARATQLAELITALAEDKAPCGFDQPERAYESVRDFGRALEVASAVQAGTADPADVRDVLDRRLDTELAPERRREMLQFLVQKAGRVPQNWDAVDRAWERIVGSDSAAMLASMVAGARELLWGATPNLAIREYRLQSARFGIEDGLLAGLVEIPRAGSPAGRMDSVRAAARNVAEALGGLASPDSFPQTRHALVGNPLVATRLLVEVPASGRDLQAILSWLEPALTGPLSAFLDILGHHRRALGPDAIRWLVDLDREYVAALLEASAAQDCLGLVLPGLARWLGYSVLGGGLSQEQRDYWRTQVQGLSLATTEAQAWADLMLLLLGYDPRYLPAGSDQRGRRKYSERVVGAWEGLSADLGPEAERALTRGLADYLGKRHWARERGQAAAVVELVGQLTANGRRRGLGQEVTGVLDQVPDAREWPFAREWLTPRKPVPPARSASYPPPTYQPGEEARIPAVTAKPRLGPGTGTQSSSVDWWSRGLGEQSTPEEVTEFCVVAFQENRTVAEVVAEVERSRAIHSGAQAFELLRAVHRTVTAPPRRPDTWDWLAEFTRLFADGRLGEPVSVEFRHRTTRHLLDGLGQRAFMLQIVAGREDGLDAKQAEYLSQLIKQLEEVQKEAARKKRSIPFLPGRNAGNQKPQQW
jgi:hypothetical protein